MKTIELKDILSISGKGGLFKYVAQARNGIVVESLSDGKRHVAPTTARVSSLKDIAIFTYDDESPLSDIFYLMYENSEGTPLPSHKVSAEELKRYFQELVPEYDEDRVYVSDIRKVIQWYNQLKENDMLEVIEKEADTKGEGNAAPDENNEASDENPETLVDDPEQAK